MNARALLIIDALLFAAVCVLVYFVLTTTAETPPEAPDFLARSEGARIPEQAESTYQYPNLGIHDVFGAPIPLPPPPEPEPERPPPVPNLSAMLQRMTVYNCFRGEAEFEDAINGERYTVHVGESIQLNSNNAGQVVPVTVLAIDDREFRIDFQITWDPGGIQQESLYMFPPD